MYALYATALWHWSNDDLGQNQRNWRQCTQLAWNSTQLTHLNITLATIFTCLIMPISCNIPGCTTKLVEKDFKWKTSFNSYGLWICSMMRSPLQYYPFDNSNAASIFHQVHHLNHLLIFSQYYQLNTISYSYTTQQKKFCSSHLNLMMISHNKQEYDKVLEYLVLGKAKGSKEADIWLWLLVINAKIW